MGFAGDSELREGYDFTGNPGLPAGGDFTAFCNIGSGTCLDCTQLISPADGATDVFAEADLIWTAVADATGYLLTLGTSPGGAELLDLVDVGNVNSYDPGELPEGSSLYVKITPYSADFTAVDCLTESFATKSSGMLICNVPAEHTLDDISVPAGEYRAQNSITSAGTIQGPDVVAFVAGNIIRLQPGFQVVLGSRFSGRIEACEPLPELSISGIVMEEEVSKTASPGISELKIIPNPVNSEASIRFTLAEEGEISLFIHDLSGEVISRPINSVYHTSGRHETSFLAGDLVPGVYVVSLWSKDAATNARMVIVK